MSTKNYKKNYSQECLSSIHLDNIQSWNDTEMCREEEPIKRGPEKMQFFKISEDSWPLSAVPEWM